MNFKILREEYYNADHVLNEQEQKGILYLKEEFLMSVKEPYWITRARAFLLDIPIFGQKLVIKQNMEILLFTIHDQIEKELPSSNDVRLNSNIDFFEKIYGRNDEKSILKIYPERSIHENKAFLEIIENLPGYRKENIPVYNIVPELKTMKKSLSYVEIYLALSRFVDSKMMFINLFKKNVNLNIASAVVYLPYTPLMLENAGNYFIRSFANYLRLHCKYMCQEIEEIKILKQKLLDIFYLVDDSEDMHGITDCNNQFKECSNIASFYCENYMCKMCCQRTVNKEYCVIHDDIVNFFRKKMQDLLEFEQRKGFDRSLTIRVCLKQRLNQKEIEKIFESYEISWENTQFLFRKGVEKIQFVYLICKTNNEAKRIYDDRTKIIKKWEKSEITIQSLMEPLEDIAARADNLELAGLLVVPVSALIKQKIIPKKSERNTKFTELIEKVLEIDKSQYKLSNCLNLINKDFSYDYFLIQFKNKALLNKFYQLQPFFESIIFHKLIHLKLFPLLRHSNFANKCLICENDRNNNCMFELCSECCGLQGNEAIIKKVKCNCSLEIDEAKRKKRSILICNTHINQEELCESCWRTKNKNCLNKMCDVCCIAQCFKKYCPVHQQSIYISQSLKNDFPTFIKNFQHKLSKIKLKLNDFLKNGDFSWYRPIADTDITRKMLDMNRELQIVMDNHNFKRDGCLKLNDKMYKLYTFQNEAFIKKHYGDFSTTEGIDLSGNFFIEYNFPSKPIHNYFSNFEEQSTNYFIPGTKDTMTSIESTQYEKDQTTVANYHLENSFHLLLYGLETERLTTYELLEELFNEIRNKVGRLEMEDIMILEEQSIINFILINIPGFRDYDKFIEYGRFAIVRMKNEKDSLKLFTNRCSVNLPLSNGKRGMPFMCPGQALISFIENNQ